MAGIEVDAGVRDVRCRQGRALGMARGEEKQRRERKPGEPGLFSLGWERG